MNWRPTSLSQIVSLMIQNRALYWAKQQHFCLCGLKDTHATLVSCDQGRRYENATPARRGPMPSGRRCQLCKRCLLHTFQPFSILLLLKLRMNRDAVSPYLNQTSLMMMAIQSLKAKFMAVSLWQGLWPLPLQHHYLLQLVTRRWNPRHLFPGHLTLTNSKNVLES